MTTVHRYGFTRLGGGAAVGDKPPTVNIIFVHGLGGHPQRTWGRGTNQTEPPDTKKRKFSEILPFRSKKTGKGSKDSDTSPPQTKILDPRPFWPNEYLPQDIPEAIVWTYGYNADIIKGIFEKNSKNSVSQHGSDLAAAFKREIDNEYPVIFVAHSLGGIVVKDALRKTASARSRTKLIVFLGTPHRGSSHASWGGIAANLARLAFQDANTRIVETLSLDGEVLDIIHDDFKDVVEEHRIKIHSFQESLAPSGVKGVKGKIVDDFSSKLDLPRSLETVEHINANHAQMVKCSSRDDERYRAISGILKHFLRSYVPENEPIHEISSSLSKQPVFCVPFQDNPDFVGRADILGAVKDRLFTDSPCRKVVLVGLGGIGKSQIALNVAYWVKKSKPDFSVFWIPVLSHATFEQACVQIIKQCAIQKPEDEDAKETVRAFLESDLSGQWLLIVDNADDIDILQTTTQNSGRLYDYLPKTGNGRIIFTTRSRNVALSVTRHGIIEIQAMSSEEATLYLEMALLDHTSVRDDPTVPKLLDKLTHLPLAISQASAYMNKVQIPPSEYLKLLNNADQDMVELMRERFYDETRYSGGDNAIITTWLVSFEQVRRIDKMAADLLLFISHIVPKSIPRSLLPGPSDLKTTEAIGTLRGYAFLTVQSDSNMYDMHSLVHLATSVWSSQQNTPDSSLRDTVSHINDLFPTDDWENRDVWRLYLPHALRIIQCVDIAGAEASSLEHKVGSCLQVDGRIQEAVGVFEKAVALDTVLPEDHPSRLASQHALAGAYEANGQVEEAVSLLEHVVSIEEKLAADHPSRLASQHALAGAYKANGQVKEAVSLLEHIVSIQEKLAEDHPSQLDSQHALAGAYKANGQVEEAVSLLEHVVSIREKLAEGHPSRLASQHELARVYFKGGRVEEGVKLIQSVVRIEAKTLTVDHPDRKVSEDLLEYFLERYPEHGETGDEKAGN